MSEFENMTIEGSLANEILDTINQFEWNPSLTTSDVIRALIMVLDQITLYCNTYEEIKNDLG